MLRDSNLIASLCPDRVLANKSREREDSIQPDRHTRSKLNFSDAASTSEAHLGSLAGNHPVHSVSLFNMHAWIDHPGALHQWARRLCV